MATPSKETLASEKSASAGQAARQADSQSDSQANSNSQAAGKKEQQASKQTQKTSGAKASAQKTKTTKKAASKAVSKSASRAATTRKTTATPKTAAAQKTKARKTKTQPSTTQAAAVKTGESVTVPTGTQMPLTPDMAIPSDTSELLDAIAHRQPSDHTNDLTSHTSDQGPEGSLTSKLAKKAEADSAHFAAADCLSADIWVPSANIPALDEATYASQKAQAEAQRRAIEVANLNLKNMNDLHQLERRSLDVAISTKENETRTAQLTNADIDYQTQLEINGEKSEQLNQAAARREAAARETGYTDQLISLKDQNFELDIQQAQDVFAQKAAHYRAQLTGGQ
ncbi:MAG: hypothetical protein AAF050_20370 [Cyanobacteria bacterium J06649_5]